MHHMIVLVAVRAAGRLGGWAGDMINSVGQNREGLRDDILRKMPHVVKSPGV